MSIDDTLLIADLKRRVAELEEENNDLKKRSALFRGLYDHMTSGSAIYKVLNDGARGSDYIIKSFNNAALNIEGKSLGEVVGRSLEDLRPAINEYGLIGVMQTVWKTGRPDVFPVKMYKDDLFSSYYENYIFKLDTGEVVTIYNDLTEQKNNELSLKISESRYRKAQEMVQLGHWEYDIERDMFWGSPQARRMYGITDGPQWILSSEIDKFAPDAPGTEESFRELILNDRPYSEEFELHPMDGSSVRVVRTSAEKVSDEQGNPIKLVGVIQDVTGQKKAEDELRTSEENFRLITMSTPDHIFVIDNELRYQLVVNPQLGLTAEEMIGKTDREILCTEDADHLMSVKNAVLESGECDLLLIPLKDSQGQTQYFEGRYRVRHDSRGYKNGLIGYFRNVTDRIASDLELKRNQARYEKAQKMGKVGNWEFDIATEQFWGSLEARRIYGFGPEPEAFSVEDVESCIPERERVHKALEDLVEYHKPYDLEFEVRPADGSNPRVIHSLAQVERDESGNAVKIFGMIQDITQQRADQEERLNLERQLRQSQKQKSIGLLAGGIAHDFNNILSSIIGYTTLALDDVDKGSELEDSLQEIYKSGTRAKDLVNQILAFARQSEVNLVPLSLGETVQDGMKLIRSLVPANIEIEVKAFTRKRVLADTTQIHQILMNLCTNAAHAMSEDGGIISVSVTEECLSSQRDTGHRGVPAGDYVKLEVADTGSGIPEESLDAVFTPYFTTKEAGKGTGMGLAIVHGIIKSYGGEILVESKIGSGAVFSVYLPQTDSRVLSAPSYKKEDVPCGTEKILLVDDESAILKSTSILLQKLGYDVTSLADSVEALKILQDKNHDFDLLITDMTMPHITGDKLAQAALAFREDFPVVICTGYSDRIDHDRAHELGIREFLLKPTTKKELALAIRSALDRFDS